MSQLPLSPDVGSAATARRYLAGVLGGWPPSARDTALLLASELVTNAIVHGGPPITMAVHLPTPATRVRVEVHDGNPRLLPTPPRELSRTDEHGRGLQIIHALAARWGSGPCPPDIGGKISWFELDST